MNQESRAFQVTIGIFLFLLTLILVCVLTSCGISTMAQSAKKSAKASVDPEPCTPGESGDDGSRQWKCKDGKFVEDIEAELADAKREEYKNELGKALMTRVLTAAEMRDALNYGKWLYEQDYQSYAQGELEGEFENALEIQASLRKIQAITPLQMPGQAKDGDCFKASDIGGTIFWQKIDCPMSGTGNVESKYLDQEMSGPDESNLPIRCRIGYPCAVPLPGSFILQPNGSYECVGDCSSTSVQDICAKYEEAKFVNGCGNVPSPIILTPEEMEAAGLEKQPNGSYKCVGDCSSGLLWRRPTKKECDAESIRERQEMAKRGELGDPAIEMGSSEGISYAGGEEWSDEACGYISNDNPPKFRHRYTHTINNVEREISEYEYRHQGMAPDAR